jgi:hypothetical protein
LIAYGVLLVYDEMSRRRLSCRWQNNIKMGLKGSDDVDWNYLTEDKKEGGGVLIYTAIEIRVL